MEKQKYILNNTYGINGIEKISLKEVMKIFSVPEEIEIKLNEIRKANIVFEFNDF